MVCPHCGARVAAAQQRYCHACGALLGGQAIAVTDERRGTMPGQGARRVMIVADGRTPAAWPPGSRSALSRPRTTIRRRAAPRPPLLWYGGAVLAMIAAVALIVLFVSVVVEVIMALMPALIAIAALCVLARPRRRRRRWMRMY